MTEAEQIMKRCQVGTRNYNEANNLHADCYRVIGKLLKTIEEWESKEPVAWMDADGNVSDNNDHKCFPIPLYTHPPQRKPLTDDQIYEMYNEPRSDAEMLEFARAIEAAHGIKE